MALYVVDTIVTFRHKYVVEAKSLQDAYDEVSMRDSGFDDDDFSEVTQRCLGETLIDGREIDKIEFDEMLKTFSGNTMECCSDWMGDELIRKVDYDL